MTNYPTGLSIARFLGQPFWCLLLEVSFSTFCDRALAQSKLPNPQQQPIPWTLPPKPPESIPIPQPSPETPLE
jgi:hypothetical protein